MLERRSSSASLLLQIGIETVSAADRESDVVGGVAPALKLIGQLLRRPILAVLVERDQPRAAGHRGANASRLCAQQAREGNIAATGLGFDQLALHFELGGKTREIFVDRCIGPRAAAAGPPQPR